MKKANFASESMNQGSNVSMEQQDLMTAYVYGLLSEEDSLKVEQQLSQSGSHQKALKKAEGQKDLLGLWEDIPVPLGLAERTFTHIRNMEKNKTQNANQITEPAI